MACCAEVLLCLCLLVSRTIPFPPSCERYMRQIATLADQHDAQVLVDYLLTQNIPAVIRPEAEQVEIWIRNEDDVERATIIWEEFRGQPDDVKFRAASKPARELRKLQEQVNKKYASLYKESDDFWGRPRPSKVPITIALIVLSVIATLYIEFGSNTQHMMQLAFTDQYPVIIPREIKGFVDPNLPQQVRERQLRAVNRGEYWRILTPIFLHMHTLHLLLNMYALYTLSGLIECRRSALWLLVFVVVTGVFSNLMQFFFPETFNFHLMELFGKKQPVIIVGALPFGGMSGVCYALFGYLMAKSLYSPEPGLIIPRDSIVIMMVWLVLCMVGVFGDIANTAHVAGLVIGLAIGVAPRLISRVRRRLTK